MIDLENLYLDGWLSYDKAEFVLNEPGVTLIQGQIGAGKSAILEAIYYLLFGKTLRGKDSVNSLVNRIVDSGYEIALEFKINSNSYLIKEIRGREKRGLYFFKNGEAVATDGAADPRKVILSTIGMSAQEFESIAFLGQKQSQILVEGTPGERAKAIVSVFGLNRYENAVKKCTELIKDINIRIEKQTEKVEQYNDEIKSIQKMLDTSEVYDAKQAKVAKDRLEKVKILITSTSSKLEKLQRLALENKQKLGMAEAVQDQQAKISLVKKEILTFKQDLEKTDWPAFTAKELIENRRELDQEKAKCSVIMTQQHAEITRITKFGDICPISNDACPVDVPNLYKSRTIRQCNATISEMQERLEKVQKKINRKNYQIALADQKAKIENAIEHKRNVLKNIRIEEAPDIDKSADKLNKCRIAIDVGNEKLEKLREEHSYLLVELSKYEQAKHHKETISSTLEERLEELQSQKEKLKKLELEYKYLTASLAILKKTKMYKIDLVLKVLNDSINEILEKISNGEYKAQFVSQQNDAKGDRILDKVGIIVTDAHKSIPVELCSGGQRDEVGLSVLLATWKTAGKLSNKAVGSLWLDEAFGALDQDAVDRVFAAVIDVAEDMGASSVKIISHRNLDARLFDHVWKISMTSGISSVTIA